MDVIAGINSDSICEDKNSVSLFKNLSDVDIQNQNLEATNIYLKHIPDIPDIPDILYWNLLHCNKILNYEVNLILDQIPNATYEYRVSNKFMKGCEISPLSDKFIKYFNIYSKYNNLDNEISKLKEKVDRLENPKDHFDY
mgnify:CR=1 FL=1